MERKRRRKRSRQLTDVRITGPLLLLHTARRWREVVQETGYDLIVYEIFIADDKSTGESQSWA
jgi:hypothetical protein